MATVAVPVTGMGCLEGTYVTYWTGPAGTERGGPGWRATYSGCLVPSDGGGAAVLTAADFQRLALPAGAYTIQPPGGRVLAGMPTIVYADTAATMLTTTVLGQPVTVRATPVAWGWDFGDGTVLGPTSNPGAPYPELINTHAYTARGEFAVTMVTYYRGEFRVAGGTWQPISGQAEVRSAPVILTVVAGRPQLVADP